MCYELRCHLKLVYLHKSKFLSYYTIRYHRCYAPRYRVDVVDLLPLDAASYHTRPWQYIIQQFNVQHTFQGFVEGDVQAPCVATLFCDLTPYPSQLRLTRTPTQIVPLQPWLETALAGLASQRLAKRKRPTFRQTFFFLSISGFLSSQAVSSQVLSAFMSLTTVFEMGTGGSSQPSPLNLSEFVL